MIIFVLYSKKSHIVIQKIHRKTSVLYTILIFEVYWSGINVHLKIFKDLKDVKNKIIAKSVLNS